MIKKQYEYSLNGFDVLMIYIIMETLGVSDCEIEEELDRLRGDAE